MYMYIENEKLQKNYKVKIPLGKLYWGMFEALILGRITGFVHSFDLIDNRYMFYKHFITVNNGILLDPSFIFDSGENEKESPSYKFTLYP